jgi:hypothetical protein
LAVLTAGATTGRAANLALPLPVAPSLLAPAGADVVRAQIEKSLLLRRAEEMANGDQIVCHATLLSVVGFDDGFDLLVQFLVAGGRFFEHGDQTASLVREFVTKPLEILGKLRIVFADGLRLLSIKIEPLCQGRTLRSGR